MSVDITFNAFDRHSIRNAINKLKLIQADLDSKTQTACMRIAEVGLNRANAEFAAVDYQGNKDCSVRVESMERGARLIASGESVYFLEYGAGAFQPDYAGTVPPGLERGSWSLSDKGKGHWDDPKGWYWAHNQKSWGNPPANAMFYAEEDMRREAQRIVSEVFGDK